MRAETMKIVVDAGQPFNIRQKLQQLGCEVEVEDTCGKGGHYILDNGKTSIERERVHEFFVNITHQHSPGDTVLNIYDHLAKIKKNYETAILLIEGENPTWEDEETIVIERKRFSIHKHTMLGTLMGVMVWCTRHKVRVVHTRDMDETARLICALAKKPAKPRKVVPR
ncbi:MAG: ERCC4 domain-containing protein [Thermoplasmata archaeon]